MAFATIDLTKGITGSIPTANLPTIPVNKGGTGLTSGTADQFLKFTGSTTVASAAVSTTAPTETYFLARGGSNYEPSLASNTTTVIVLPNEVFDTHNGYNTSTGRYTVASGQAGKYYLYGRFSATNQGDRGDLNISITAQGTTIGGTTDYVSSPDNYPKNEPNGAAAIVDLNVGDWVDFRYYGDGGGYAHTGNYSIYFGGFKIA